MKACQCLWGVFDCSVAGYSILNGMVCSVVNQVRYGEQSCFHIDYFQVWD